MFFIYSLAALALLSALIFAVPLRAKAWTALALVGVGALAGEIGRASCRERV